jgi:hypothetical protein
VFRLQVAVRLECHSDAQAQLVKPRVLQGCPAKQVDLAIVPDDVPNASIESQVSNGAGHGSCTPGYGGAYLHDGDERRGAERANREAQILHNGLPNGSPTPSTCRRPYRQNNPSIATTNSAQNPPIRSQTSVSQPSTFSSAR